MDKHYVDYKAFIKQDLSASIVVFLVALPLCLGIALASGAPLISGLLAGIVGGLIVSWLSGSQLSVSGPAAGLTIIVFNAIEQLGSYSAFLVSVVLAGVIQFILGYLRAGAIGAFFPSSVIKGMLAAIGLILIIKQLPHAVGYDISYLGDESYMNETASSSFHNIFRAFESISLGSILVTAVALFILVLWESPAIKRNNLLSFIPSPLLAVCWGILFNLFASNQFPEYSISKKHLVSLPPIQDASQLLGLLKFPDFSFLDHPQIYTVALTLAIIASLETLLSLEAVDKLDPLKRTAPTNRELKAQGVGNMISGLIGGLPVTAVIVRSSANINAGGRTKLACFLHGVLLLLSILFFTRLINQVPLACLAAILLQTGYKLAKPQTFISLYQQGMNQFLPFLITIVAILATDLLQGVLLGICVGMFFVVKSNFHEAFSLHKNHEHYTLTLHKDVSFLNKYVLRQALQAIEDDSILVIDASRAKFIDFDIMEMIEDFRKSAPEKGIKVEFFGLLNNRLLDDLKSE